MGKFEDLLNICLKNNILRKNDVENEKTFSSLFYRFPNEMANEIIKGNGDLKRRISNTTDLEILTPILTINPNIINLINFDFNNFMKFIPNHNEYLKYITGSNFLNNLSAFHSDNIPTLDFEDVLTISSKLDESQRKEKSICISKYLSNDDKLKYIKLLTDSMANDYKSGSNELKEFFIKNYSQFLGLKDNDSLFKDEFFIEKSKKITSVSMLRAISNDKILTYFKKRYKDCDSIEFFKRVYKEILNLKNPENLSDFCNMNNSNKNKLKMNVHKNYSKFISNVFGNEFGELVDKREGLFFDTTSSFLIFDDKIKNIFGDDFINMFLTYKFQGAPIFFNIINDNKREELEAFSKFYADLQSIYKRDEIAFEIASRYFYNFKDLYISISNTNLNKEQKNNLSLALLDIETPVELSDIYDLNTYAKRRRDFILENESASFNDNPSLYFKHFLYAFMLPLENNVFGKTDKNFSLYSIIKSSDNDVLKSITFENKNKTFSKEEIAMLNIIRSVKNLITEDKADDIVEKINTKFLSSNELISPLDFNETRQKISDYYFKDLTSKLTQKDELEKSSSSLFRKNNIEKKNNQGIDCFYFKGYPFKMLVHSISANFSRLFNYEIDQEAFFDIFTKTEAGISTISLQLLSENFTLNESDMKLQDNACGFVFNDISHSLILNASDSDIHNSHNIMNPIPSSDYVPTFKKPKEILICTGKRNEVGVNRRKSNGERIYPDAIYLENEPNEKDLILVKKFNDFYKKQGIKNIDGTNKIMSIYVIQPEYYGNHKGLDGYRNYLQRIGKARENMESETLLDFEKGITSSKIQEMNIDSYCDNSCCEM